MFMNQEVLRRKLSRNVYLRFHSNLQVNPRVITYFCLFLKKYLKFVECQSFFYFYHIFLYFITISLVQQFYNNNYININNKLTHFENFSKHRINFLPQLYDGTDNIKNRTHLRMTDLNDNFHFKCVQLIQTIQRDRKLIIKQNIVSHDLLVPDNHLIYRNRLGNIQKIRSEELYGIFKSLRSSIQTTKLF